jgi:hypothetical protein
MIKGFIMKNAKNNSHKHTHNSHNAEHKNIQNDLVLDLTEEEISSLIHMYQEEKLAMDIYDSFADTYDEVVFDKISDSEETHMNVVGKLLTSAGVDITELQSLESGEFIDEDIQTLYETLLAQGSLSLEEALNVGVDIEIVDSQDLYTFLEDENLDSHIVEVYTKLASANENHLEAFTTALDADIFIA